MTAVYDAVPTPELIAALADLKARESADRAAMLDTWLSLGGRLDELRERHLRGLLGKGSWASWCKRHGFTRVWVDRWIDVARAENPAARLDEILVFDAQMSMKGSRSEPRTIFIKRPAVIYGYILDLDEAGKREVFAFCYRDRPLSRIMHQVEDELRIDPDEEDRPPAHPS